MKRLLSLILLAGVLAGTLALAPGCKSPSGSHEYLPGKGWVPTD
jgi:hypothetical protein